MFRAEAIRKQFRNTRFFHAAVDVSLSKPLLVVAGDEENRHALCTELADDLATYATRRDGGCNVAVSRHQQDVRV